jgi:ankyrin repeat protein
MPRLPSDPSLEHLRGQAKRLLRAIRTGEPSAWAETAGEIGDPGEPASPELRAAAAGDPDAPVGDLARDLVGRYHPRPPAPAEFRLADAQLVVARAYGFASWPKLASHLAVVERYSRVPHRQPTDEGSLADRFLVLACLTYGADDESRVHEARELLAAHPELPSMSLCAAAAAGDAEAARPLLAGARREDGPHRWEPLVYLTYSRVSGEGAVAVARLLLDAGADPSAGYLWEGLPSPFTALTGALGRGEGDPPPHPYALALARMLLEAGADANDAQTIYNYSWTPGDDWLELLYEFGLGRGDGGVWPRRLGSAHPTPAQLVEDLLLWSLRNGLTERVQLILRHPVDVNGHGTRHPLMQGRSALEQALLDGSTEMAEALRAAGAREPELDAGQRLEGALMRGDRAEAERLRGAPVRPGLIARAAELDRADAIRLMAEHGLDVNAGRITALHEAAVKDNRPLVDLLLELGADPNIRDAEYDATPAGWAEHFGHTQLAAELRERETT